MWKEALAVRSKSRSDWAKGFPFAFDFLYNNRLPARTILFRCRLMILLASLILACCVYVWTNKFFGSLAGLTALIFYVFCPNIIAHSTLATEDLLVTAFIFLSVCSFYRFYDQASVFNALLFGTATASALLAKYSGVIVLPIFVALFLCLIFICKKSPSRFFFRRLPISFFALIGLFILIYHGSHVDEYFKGLRTAADYIGQGHQSYLMGKYSEKGFWHYFIIAFLLKTTIPFLFAIAIAGYFGIRQYRNPSLYLLLIPVLFLLAASVFAPLKIGHRHILPIYPFLFVLAGTLVQRVRWRYALVFLLPWHTAESLAVCPHYLSYFNEIAGGPKNGWRYLIDSNTDWGQDITHLQNYVRQNPDAEMVLSYFGPITVKAVGFSFQDFLSMPGFGKDASHINSPQPSKEILAISVTNLQGLYFYQQLGPDPFGWLKIKKPIGRAGYSILLYDITNDAYVHEQMAYVYYLYGEYGNVQREAERAISLDPKRVWARYLLAFIAVRKGNWKQGITFALEAMKADSELQVLQEKISTPLVATIFAPAMINLSAAFFSAGKTDIGIKFSLMAAKLDPANPTAYVNLSFAYRDLGYYQQAIDAADKALIIKALDKEALYNKSLSLSALGRHQESKAVLRLLLQAYPKEARARTLLNSLP
ncbi:MAG: glycosyltransferase family 39 protein [Elusimicrobia bacterium]|nr:glycosyltransferase family 39 protein [Elusimicrobiota bacterium]